LVVTKKQLALCISDHVLDWIFFLSNSFAKKTLDKITDKHNAVWTTPFLIGVLSYRNRSRKHVLYW